MPPFQAHPTLRPPPLRKGETMSNTKYVDCGAEITGDGRYRYKLWREWRNHPKPAKWDFYKDGNGKPILDGGGHSIGWPVPVLFIMLNPSTANEEDDDPTIRKCVGFARRWGYDRVEVVNLFAFRATDPRILLRLQDKDEPYGVRNQAVVERSAADAGLIVCAWGAHGGHLGQDQTILGWLDRVGKPLHTLGFTKGGQPRHPLMLSYDTRLEPMR